MAQLIELLERKILDLKEQAKKQGADYDQASSTIEKLRLSRKTAIKNLHILDGAIQAYSDILEIEKSKSNIEVIED